MLRGLLLATLLLAGGSAAAETRYDTPWAKISAPAPGTVQAIGGPARGCILGAHSLAPDGTGFEVLRRWRNRFWGHTELIDYLTRLGKKLIAAGMKPMLIGDMSQPRGGPMATGHRSHQIGIDADIMFTPGPLSPQARETFEDPPSMLTADGGAVDPARFGRTQLAMLKLAAADPQVARIFVNFHIKKYLCGTLAPGERAWIGKLRPWLGHDEHFHVRLRCPTDSPKCEEQDPVPTGDGCDDTLAAWFRPAPPPDPNAPKPAPAKPKPLPAACTTVLSAR
ncbi:penicillin-insensitive murein endopeptidase [Zavarzinia sp.]|uniref:penicillin-insensitive murein endopeptidase n=1 Tax=Zavarzinia sp. TaxID=2027920 RepID=UPI0035629488